MAALASQLRDEILQSGPMPFRRFMERALYDARSGYYASGKAEIGRRGDFVTSVSAGPLFGRLLVVQFEEMWRKLGSPERFEIVEEGANNGDFAHDVLTAARAVFPEFAAALYYRILEPFEVNAGRQRQRLAEFAGQVTWFPSLEAMPSFVGVHFSNELVDAFPVAAVVFRDGAWRERWVTWCDGAFGWTERPLSDPAVLERLSQAPCLEGYETEVNLEAPLWLGRVAARLERGYVLVVDYGFSRADYYIPERREGTLSAYRRQQRQADVLARPGEQDITAHVDFTALAEAGLASGMRLAGFADQHHVLASLGRSVFPDITDPAGLTLERQRDLRAFSMLMHPSLMGLGFQYLALAKAAPARLCGYGLVSRGAAVTLGLEA